MLLSLGLDILGLFPSLFRCDCDGYGRRETDTMDTFVDSSWYFLRYLDSANQSQLISPAAANLMPVDLYIGGKEHGLLICIRVSYAFAGMHRVFSSTWYLVSNSGWGQALVGLECHDVSHFMKVL